MSITKNNESSNNSNLKHKKAGIIKFIKANVAYIFVVVWAGLLALWSEPFLADYYQKQVNSHYDTIQWVQMGPVFLVAMILCIFSFVKKKYLVGILTGIIAIWAFYWAFGVSFSCFQCTYGG